MSRLFSVLAGILLALASGCGYLDDDLLVDDEAFEASIGEEEFFMEGMSFSGRGCGGGHGYYRRNVRPRHGSYRIDSDAGDAALKAFLADRAIEGTSISESTDSDDKTSTMAFGSPVALLKSHVDEERADALEGLVTN